MITARIVDGIIERVEIHTYDGTPDRVTIQLGYPRENRQWQQAVEADLTRPIDFNIIVTIHKETSYINNEWGETTISSYSYGDMGTAQAQMFVKAVTRAVQVVADLDALYEWLQTFLHSTRKEEEVNNGL